MSPALLLPPEVIVVVPSLLSSRSAVLNVIFDPAVAISVAVPVMSIFVPPVASYV